MALALGSNRITSDMIEPLRLHSAVISGRVELDSRGIIDRDGLRDIPSPPHAILRRDDIHSLRRDIFRHQTPSTRIDANSPKIHHILHITKSYAHAIEIECERGEGDGRAGHISAHDGGWEADDDVE